jgi:hypothetical protein
MPETPLHPEVTRRDFRTHGTFATLDEARNHLALMHVTAHPVSDFDLDAAVRAIVTRGLDVEGTFYGLPDGDLWPVIQQFRIAPTVPERHDAEGNVVWREDETDPRAVIIAGMQQALAELNEKVDVLEGQNAKLISQLAERDTELDVARLDVRNATARANENSARITELNRQMDRVVAEKDVAEEALKAFKHQVRLVTTDEAEKHDWCPEVDRVLGRLGLTRLSFAYTARVEVGIDIRVTRPLSKEISQTPDEDAVAEMLLNTPSIEAAIRRHLNIDEEHTDFDIDDITWSVEEVIEVDSE